jgi:hypothetical protein
MHRLYAHEPSFARASSCASTPATATDPGVPRDLTNTVSHPRRPSGYFGESGMPRSRRSSLSPSRTRMSSSSIMPASSPRGSPVCRS